MNQYIITEELLQEAMENTIWGRTNQQKFRDKLTLYQSERDKLEELVSWIEKGECSIDIFYRTQDGRELEAVGIETEGLLKKISELRQAGEQ